MLKVNNRNTRTRYKVCSKLTIKHQNDAIINFEQVNTGWVIRKTSFRQYVVETPTLILEMF